MALKKIIFKPGINRDQTNYANEGGWWAGNKVRFLSGYPQKIGGWVRYTVAPYVGLCRALFNWVASAGFNLMAIGTNTKIYVESGANLYDITPLRATYTNLTTPSTTNCIGTTNGTKTITITLSAAHGASTGDYVTVSGVTGGTIGGIPVANINGEFVITVTGATTFTFEASGATNATSTVSGQGGTTVVLAFQISANTSSTVSGYGWGIPTWGGDVPSGTDTGWGIGALSPFDYSIRLIYFDKRVEDLTFNIRYGDLYYWDFTNGTSLSSRAVSFKTLADTYSPTIDSADVPEGVTFSMFEDTTGVVMTFGCSPYGGGTVDPLLVRWSSAFNPQNATVPYYLRWAPDIDPGVSTAGYLSIQSGSQILYAISNYGEVLVFTESSLTSLQAQYTTGTLNFAQSLKSEDITLIGPRCVIVRNNVVYWMGIDRFYYYDGIARIIPCTLRQQVFDNINFEESDQFFAAANDKYNEIWWFYCSANSAVIDSYVVFNYAEQLWYYGNCDDGMVRTAWIDSGYRVNPVAAGAFVENGAYSTNDSSRNYLYNHENGNDDNNGVEEISPIYSYIQSSDVDMDPDGDKFILLRRIIPDVSFDDTSAGTNPTAVFSVVPRNFPGAAYMTQNQESQTFNRSVSAQSVTIDQYTNQVFLRARARQMGFKIESSDLGVAWQLGAPRVDIRQDGMRG